MNPYACRVVLRPRSPLEVLDLSARLLQVEAGRFVRLSAIVLLPLWGVAVALSLLADASLVVGATLLVIAPALQVPFTVLGARALFSSDVRLRDVLRELPRQAGAATVSVVSRLAVAVGGLITLGLLWLPLHVILLFQPEVSALERQPLGAALRRAAGLAGDQVGKALVGSLGSVIVGAWTIFAVESLGQALVAWVLQAGTPFGSALDGDVTPYVLLGILLAQPLIALFRLLLYVDVRTVLEGWDLQVALRAAAQEAA